MLKFFKRIWMGAGYLEGYGYYPGYTVLSIYILASGLAGIRQGGWDGFWGGIAIALLAFGPIFLAGCYSRAKNYEQDVESTFNRLQRKY